MNEILIMSGKSTGLLRMTNWVVEIGTSSNQRTVGLLVMTVLDKNFHYHLVLLGSMRAILKI
jgi:hypothetical protein